MEPITDLEKSIYYKIVKSLFVLLYIGTLVFSLLYAFGPPDSFYEELFNGTNSEETAYQNVASGGYYGTNRV